MTSLCSDASSSVSSRPRQSHDQTSWERSSEENPNRKDKSSIFTASPWAREEKEKLHQEQVLDARRARDHEIAFLESVPERSEKQEEWLRILRLEREFQRRAEQELHDEDELSGSGSDTDSDKMDNFHRDKLTVIPNERMGLKLLDELLDNPTKNTTSSDNCNHERDVPLRNPPEKHFIPLDVAIPENELQTSSLPLTNNILKISSDQHSDGSRMSKPPIPAPRPSKNLLVLAAEAQKSFDDFIESEQNDKVGSDSESNVSSLAKLKISDASAYFCSSDSEDRASGPREIPQDDWMIEVPSNFPDCELNSVETKTYPNKPSDEQSRIYENIQPTDYHYTRAEPNSANSFASHTLPKSSTSGTGIVAAKEPWSGSRHIEKRFPSMGVSSTLTKKSNGFTPSDADILPSLYASYKIQNKHTKEVPADLADKSPEFKKLWISRPEKLTFQDKIRKFSIQAGEDDLPRDRVKNSRAQRELEIKFSESQKRVGVQKVLE